MHQHTNIIFGIGRKGGRAAAIFSFLWILAAGGATARDHLSAVGSSTVFPFTATISDLYSRANRSAAAPVIESTGTGGGFKIFCGGIGERFPDINNASRRMEPSEYDTCRSHGIEAVEFTIGMDGITLVQSQKAAAFYIDSAILYKALAAKVPIDGRWVDNPYKKWSDIREDLPDTPIRVMGPPTTSGTRDAFETLAMAAGLESLPQAQSLSEEEKALYVKTLREDGGYIDAGENDNLLIKKVGQDKDLLGIVGFSYATQNRNFVHMMPFQGVAPSEKSIADGRYALSRPLLVYVKKEHIALFPEIKTFMTLYLDEKSIGDKGVLAAQALIPLTMKQREAERAKLQSWPAFKP